MNDTTCPACGEPMRWKNLEKPRCMTCELMDLGNAMLDSPEYTARRHRAQVEALRARMMPSLSDDDLRLLETLVHLGGTYAAEAVARGPRSWHPYLPDRMSDLAGPGQQRAQQILEQLKRRAR